MQDAQMIARFGKRRESCQSRASGNVVDWNEIDGVVDIRNKSQLYTAFH